MGASNKNVRNAVALDKFYTKADVALQCWEKLEHDMTGHGISLAQSLVIEPSAGGGVFIDSAPAGVRVHAFDIAPDCGRSDIRRHDFLAAPLPRMRAPGPNGARLVVGNPPFRSKSQLALDFIERAWTEAKADVVAFILPVQFRKWSAQRHVDAGARLVADIDVRDDAFEVCGSMRRVRCCFQVWLAPRVGDGAGAVWSNMRLQAAPPTRHRDFEAYQYNRMPGSEQLFEREWDFAVLRQGYGDYSARVFRSDQCDRRKQWILFKAHTPNALRLLKELDFTALSRGNTTVPGFGKANVVEAYETAKAAEGRTTSRSGSALSSMDCPDRLVHTPARAPTRARAPNYERESMRCTGARVHGAKTLHTRSTKPLTVLPKRSVFALDSNNRPVHPVHPCKPRNQIDNSLHGSARHPVHEPKRRARPEGSRNVDEKNSGSGCCIRAAA
jgi:hypothetical protein